MHLWKAAALAVAGTLMFVPTATAERVKPNITFFSGAQDDAHWTPKDSSDANRMSIELEVGPALIGDFGHAGIEFNHVEGRPAPEVEPYFWHREDRVAEANVPGTGGSPRLSIIFVDGGVLELRPDEWSTEWRKVGGDGEHGESGNWDVRGVPTCPYQYDAEYEEARTCFGETPVAEVILVTDSNWQPDKANGYTNWVDQIQYDGFVFSHASDNNNSPNPGS